MFKVTLFFVSLTFAITGFAQHHEDMQHSTTHASPYVEQLSSPIAGLSQQEINDLLTGQGMGFARPAELSSYPGPIHLLELQEELALTSKQVEAIQAIFKTMNTNAVNLGEEIVDLELLLSTSFKNKEITPEKLQSQTQVIAELYGQLRAVHLNAHLEVTPLLTAEQIKKYDVLRGYSQ